MLIDSIGSYFSVTGIANTLTSSGIKTNPVTIGNYIEYLKDVFLSMRFQDMMYQEKNIDWRKEVLFKRSVFSFLQHIYPG